MIVAIENLCLNFHADLVVYIYLNCNTVMQSQTLF